MRHIIFLIVMALASIQTASAVSDPYVKLIEDATETDSKSFTLPGSTSGELYFSNCAACNRKPLKLSNSSRFFVGTNEISYDSFKTAFGASKRQLITVYFLPETSIVTRIQLFVAK